MVLIQRILWTLEVFTCRHFGSRLFDYVSFFNAHALWVKRGFSELVSRSPGKGTGHVTCVLTVIKPTLSLSHDSKLPEGRTLSQSCLFLSHRLSRWLLHLCPGQVLCDGEMDPGLKVEDRGELTGGLPQDSLQKCFFFTKFP